MKDLRMTDFLKCDLRHEQAKFGWCYDIIINIGWINKCKKTELIGKRNGEKL